MEAGQSARRRNDSIKLRVGRRRETRADASRPADASMRRLTGPGPNS